MTDDRFDVWTDRHEPLLRLVITRGTVVPDFLDSEFLVRLGSARVTAFIAAEIRRSGYCSFKTTVPFEAMKVLGEG